MVVVVSGGVLGAVAGAVPLCAPSHPPPSAGALRPVAGDIQAVLPQHKAGLVEHSCSLGAAAPGSSSSSSSSTAAALPATHAKHCAAIQHSKGANGSSQPVASPPPSQPPTALILDQPPIAAASASWHVRWHWAQQAKPASWQPVQ